MDSLWSRAKYGLLGLWVRIIRPFISRPTSPKNQHFFVFGSGRNGSTLLAALLNKQPGLFVPPEQFALPFGIMKWYLFPRRRAVASIVKDFNRQKMLEGRPFRSTKNWTGIGELVDDIFIHAADEGVQAWGDKTPLNTEFLKVILPEFPKARLLFLTRDPRDVVASYLKMFAGDARGMRKALRRWKQATKTYERIKHQRDILLIRYEDLVVTPEESLRRVLSHIGYEFKTIHLDIEGQAERLGVDQLSHHQNLDHPISARSVGNWKQVLSDQQIKYVERNCGKEMKKLGYV